MNNKYVIDGDKVIVTNGNLRVMKNSDKLEEILMCENSIEIVEERLDKLKNVLRERVACLKKRRGNIFFSILLIIVSFVISNMIFKMIYGNLELASLELLKDFSFILKNIKVSTIGASVMSSVFVLNFIDLWLEKKKIKNSIRGLISERKYLMETLNSERTLLEKLTKEISNEKVVPLVKEIEDIDVKKLYNSFDIQYDCGYYEKKFERYYRNDSLNRKLSNDYSQDEIEQIDKYFEDRKCVKKRVRRK